MSGDHGLRSSIPASLAALQENPSLSICLVGDRLDLSAALQGKSYDAARLEIKHSVSVVAMDDKPSSAIRRKRDSSMAIALELLNRGEVAAVVSAGNSGALVAMGCLIVERLPGIRRPAMCAPIPSRGGRTLMLDLGANVDCCAKELHQFAVMGSALAYTLAGGAVRPRVALLNIGGELLKGKDYLREAAALISADERLNYVGFVESGEIFGDRVDVVVCEGFVGNIALKACEGTASFIAAELKKELNRGLYKRFVGLLALPVLRSFRHNIDPQRYNGAALLGLRGVVVKSHGGSQAVSFQSAIRQAYQAASLNLPQLIAEQLQAAGKQ